MKKKIKNSQPQTKLTGSYKKKECSSCNITYYSKSERDVHFMTLDLLGIKPLAGTSVKTPKRRSSWSVDNFDGFQIYLK